MLELAQLIARLADSRSNVVFVPRPEDDPSIRQPDISLTGLRPSPTSGVVVER